jgi:hypothetical protein
MLSVSPHGIRRLHPQGRNAHIRVNSRLYRFRRSDVVKWLRRGRRNRRSLNSQKARTRKGSGFSLCREFRTMKYRNTPFPRAESSSHSTREDLMIVHASQGW